MIDLTRFSEWLYNDNILHSPVTSESDSDDHDYEPSLNDLSDFQERTGFAFLKKCLKETGFNGRVCRTSSYSSLGSRSQRNFRCHAKKMLFHVLNLFTNMESETVWKDLLEDEYNCPVDEK